MSSIELLEDLKKFNYDKFLEISERIDTPNSFERNKKILEKLNHSGWKFRAKRINVKNSNNFRSDNNKLYEQLIVDHLRFNYNAIDAIITSIIWIENESSLLGIKYDFIQNSLYAGLYVSSMISRVSVLNLTEDEKVCYISGKFIRRMIDSESALLIKIEDEKVINVPKVIL